MKKDFFIALKNKSYKKNRFICNNTKSYIRKYIKTNREIIKSHFSSDGPNAGPTNSRSISYLNKPIINNK